MTACQTLAQSLSASPSATSYPTTQFSLPPSYHHEISDLSAYNRSFPPKIKCCVDRLSWLHSGHSWHCNILSAIGIRADIEQPLLTVPWLSPVACTNRPTLVPIQPRVGARKTHTAASS